MNFKKNLKIFFLFLFTSCATVPSNQVINEDKNEKHLVEQWVHLCKGLWFKNAVITPTSFHRIVQITAISKGYPEFSGFSQNDSQEFLQFFLECMHNGLSREDTPRYQPINSESGSGSESGSESDEGSKEEEPIKEFINKEAPEGIEVAEFDGLNINEEMG